MDSLRLVAADPAEALVPCCRCGAQGQSWDRLAGMAYCPDCEETLARGEGPPLIAPTERRTCCVCDRLGTVPYRTQPLHAAALLEMDLCPEHFRALLSRCLGPFAYQQLCRQLRALRVGVEQVFLLHDAFYDPHGRALQPVSEDLD
jgi:hypothetical protein